MRRKLWDEAVAALERGLTSFDTWIQSISPSERELLLFELIGSSGLPWIAIAKERGVNVDARTDEGHSIFVEAIYLWRNPLKHDAAGIRQRVYQNVLELLAAGADPNPKSTDPFSAVALAVTLDVPELATLLVLGGARLDCLEPDYSPPTNLRSLLLSSDRPWAISLVHLADRTGRRGVIAGAV